MAMTPRERWLGALRHEPLDRLPFWPKIFGSYTAARTGSFRDRTVDQLHEWIGSDQHVFVPGCVREVRSRTRVTVAGGAERHEVRFETPHGTLARTEVFDAPSCSWHPVDMPVKSVGDVGVMTAFYEDCQPELDRAGLEKAMGAVRAVGESASRASGFGESPLMEFVEHLAGVETAHFLLADHPAEVEALFSAMHRVLLRKAEIELEHSPADMVYLTENTSTTLISPDQYRAYCLPYISEYARIARQHGRHLVLHMCGHLKDILPELAKLDVAAFEAFTSPPVGNARLQDGRAACPKVCLIGGTNATLWMQPASVIIAELERDLAALPHHRGIVVTSAGVMPPCAEPDTVREVCRWVQSYPARW